MYQIGAVSQTANYKYDPDSDCSGYILLQFAVHNLFGILA
jgi:hypothetical protein